MSHCLHKIITNYQTLVFNAGCIEYDVGHLICWEIIMSEQVVSVRACSSSLAKPAHL